MKKRLLSLALCLVLVVGLFSGLTVNASASKIDDLKKQIAEKLIKEKIEQLKEEFEIPDLDMDAILSSFGTAATSGDFGENNCLHWEVSTGVLSGKTLTISGTGAMPDFDFPNGNLAPWWNYEALGMLTSFGNFKLEGELKKVVIKDGVTNVSNYALFFLPAATQITLPESVTSIGRYGIALCSKLNGISLPRAVTAIGDFGLAGNSFTAVSLPDGLQALGRGAFDRRRQELADRLAGLRAETASLEAERETILRTTQQIHELFEEMAGDRKARLDQIAQAETGTQQLQQTLQMHERLLAELRQRAETLRGELAACSSRKLELEGQRTRTDRDAQARNRDLLDMQGLVSRFEQKKLSADMEEKQILDKLWDNYELSRTAAEALRQPIENMTKASRRIAELRRGIGALGTPNLGAIDEFTRVNTRYTFLTGQRDDILKAKRELTGIIADVTGEMEGIFTTQFQAIDQAFRQTFLELFGGGKAALVLEDPEHVLDSGIEIKVQPPGKALSTLSLMSGGEMAFVAIALYFAILKVRPTPFCVMDEIEAALDEANVTRYVQYMRRLAKSTQFLVITHRRGTMEEADHLFGVTMQEKGVSRIIELSLDEAAKTIS